MFETFLTYYLNFVELFWDILVEMSPWFLIGFLFSGMLKVLIPEDFLTKHLGKSNFSSVLKATLFGIPLPLCSCGVIPMACSLHKNGASKGAVSSFLISTPQTGIDSIFVTYALLGLPFTLVRLLVALISGILGGIFTNLIFAKEENANKLVENPKHKVKIIKTNYQKLIEIFHYAFISMIQDLGKWIVIGLLFSTLITFLIPDDFFQANFANTWKEFTLMILIAVPLYVCATGSIPMAMAFALKGISPGAILLFLMLGPATNSTTITVLIKSLGGKFTLTYLVSIISVAVFFGILINMFLPQHWFDLSNFSSKEVSHHFGIFGEIAAIILLMLLLYNFFFSSIKFKSKPNIKNNMQEFNVEGMTCNHCKMSVEKNLLKIDGVTKVEVDLILKKVNVQGKFSQQEIKNCILDLGFDLK